MIIIRPVEEKDIKNLIDLAALSGGGLTTFPVDENVLKKRVTLSKKSFKSQVSQPGQEYYFLVMEDTELDRIVGTSAIFATVGMDKPFYNYKILHITQESQTPPLRIDTRLLSLANDYRGATEVATLFLAPSHRKDGNGSLLSRSRYLLMASNPHRFSDTVMAELRGWVDEKGQSPFWNALGRHFFNMEYDEADLLSGQGNSQFIADLMPKFPIYTNLLPESAREVIGKPHDKTIPAMKILKKEGFKYRGGVDIFDAGPCLEGTLENLKSVKNTQMMPIGNIENSVKGEEYIVANPNYDQFRALYAPVMVEGGQNPAVTISRKIADVLGVDVGDTLQILKHER